MSCPPDRRDPLWVVGEACEVMHNICMRLPIPVPARDESVVGHWVIAPDEGRGVVVSRLQDGADWPWTVEITSESAPSVTDDGYASAVESALRAAPGVRDVQRRDSETWLVAGRPWGFALARAAGRALSESAEPARQAVEA